MINNLRWIGALGAAYVAFAAVGTAEAAPDDRAEARGPGAIEAEAPVTGERRWLVALSARSAELNREYGLGDYRRPFAADDRSGCAGRTGSPCPSSPSRARGGRRLRLGRRGSQRGRDARDRGTARRRRREHPVPPRTHATVTPRHVGRSRSHPTAAAGDMTVGSAPWPGSTTTPSSIAFAP